VECEVNSVPWRKLKKLGDFVDLPLYREWTDIVGTQLLAGQGEAQIPVGQTDQISRLVSESSGTSGICEDLMPLHCLLEMDVSRRSELEGEWVLVLLECLESIDGIVHQLCSCNFRVGK